MLSFLAHNNVHATVIGLNNYAPKTVPSNGVIPVFSRMWASAFDDRDCRAGFLYFRPGSLPEPRWLLWILFFPCSPANRQSTRLVRRRSRRNRGLSII